MDRHTKRTGRIAIGAVVSSATAAIVAVSILVGGFLPIPRQVIETFVPPLFGLEPVAVTALAPTVGVTTGVILAVLLESTIQFLEARETLLELEGESLEN